MFSRKEGLKNISTWLLARLVAQAKEQRRGEWIILARLNTRPENEQAAVSVQRWASRRAGGFVEGHGHWNAAQPPLAS